MTLSWAFATEATPLSLRVLDCLQTSHAVTPALWPFEVTNALVEAERRGRISPTQQAEFLERLRLLPITVEHRPAVWLGQQIFPLARAHRLTAYDAAYLELAIREGPTVGHPRQRPAQSGGRGRRRPRIRVTKRHR